MTESGLSDQPDSLLERDSELKSLDEALDAARQGKGGVTVIEGAAGVGKSTILAHGCDRARDADFLVLGANGNELERVFPFGVAIQLLAEPALRGARRDPELFSGAAELAMPLLEGRAAAPPGDPASAFPLLHGLHWLVAGLAERSPLLIAVDDAHWVDAPSLRFLAYLAQRLEALPVALALTVRSGEAVAPETGSRIAQLRDHPLAKTMALAPLGEESTRAMVAHELQRADWELGSAFFAATDGNPFLLRELLGAAREEGEITAAGVEKLRPAGVRASILVRLGRLGEDARRLALATAVLGRAASSRRAGELAGLDREATAGALGALAAAHILAPGEPLAFVHPIVREMVYADIPAAGRRRDHVRAAGLLRDSGGSPEEIASQLTPGDPVGEDWAVAALREAAGQALGSGAAETAIGFLRRALVEPGRSDDPSLLLELGRAEMAAADPAALGHLEAARDLAREPSDRIAALASLGQALYVIGDSKGAFESIRAALDLVPPGDGGPPEAELICYSMPSGRLVPELVDDVKAITGQPREGAEGAPAPAEIARRAIVALDLLWQGERDASERELEWVRGQVAERDAPSSLPTLTGATIGLCLCFLGRYADAQAVTDRLVEGARRRGGLLDFAVCLETRLGVNWRRGDVNACTADCESLLVLNESGWETATVPTRVIAAEMALERNDRSAAELLLAPAREVEGRLPGTLGWLWLPYGKTRLAIDAGDWQEALEQALTTGERLLAVQIPSPDYLPWRSIAARAAARLGDAEQARSLAEEEVELARTIGSAQASGTALAALGTIRGEDGGTELLEEAVAELDRSEAELEPARARLELGIALRQARRAREARGPLGEAADAARRLGSVRLAERALEEVRAAGGRPKSLALSGVESLTPGQLRVAKMAADGGSNREIAEALFITRRTVETHLTQVYGKLEIGSREELPAALSIARRK